MKFWLTTLGLYFVIAKSSKGKEKVSKEIGTSRTPLIVELDKVSSSSEKSKTSDDDFDEKDLFCHGRILSALSENVYPIFCTTKTVIEL